MAGTTELSPRELNERVIAALNEGDVDRALSFVSDDAIDHSAAPDTPKGLAGWRQKWEGMLVAFPDLHFEIEKSVEQDGFVANRSRMSGTQKGDFMEIPASGRRFEVTVLDMVRVHDAKVAEHWALIDQADFDSQLRGS